MLLELENKSGIIKYILICFKHKIVFPNVSLQRLYWIISIKVDIINIISMLWPQSLYFQPWAQKFTYRNQTYSLFFLQLNTWLMRMFVPWQLSHCHGTLIVNAGFKLNYFGFYFTFFF